MVSHRSFIIIGNWKMHKTCEEALSFVKNFISSFQPKASLLTGLAVPYTLIYPLSQAVAESSLLIGAQNMNDASEGAFTGEIAASMIKDAGAQFVLLGHSERRRLYGEDDAFINRKLKKAIETGIRPILCIGETKEQYERKETHSVIESQLAEGLKEIEPGRLKDFILAYEPIWAIGNGHSASPENVQEVHQFCRKILKQMLSDEIGENIVIQYGGSVNSSNAQSFLEQPDVDGLLIGGASLSLDSFLQIVNNDYSKIQSAG